MRAYPADLRSERSVIAPSGLHADQVDRRGPQAAPGGRAGTYAGWRAATPYDASARHRPKPHYCVLQRGVANQSHLQRRDLHV
jgi:hypothetical protein